MKAFLTIYLSTWSLLTRHASSVDTTTCAESTECVDSPLRFNTIHNGEEYRDVCSSIASSSDAEKIEVCSYKGVDSHCPVTCGTCTTYKDSDSALGTFYGGIKVDDKKWFRCDEITDENVEERCSMEGVKETCNIACGFDECVDSPLRFNSIVNGTDYKSTCASIAILSDTEKVEVCSYNGVDNHCPVTCENCATKMSDSLLGTYYGGLKIDGKKWFRCSEINAENMEERCSLEGVKETCTAACACASSSSRRLSVSSATTLSLPLY